MNSSEYRTPDFEFDPELAASYMARALELAERGRGRVEPNPMVGCVIVNATGQIVGEGYHTQYGAAHAEVEALQVAGSQARGATMFVTLEPCCHHGKTPPCTRAVIKAGVKRVVAAMRDPFRQVAGGGLAELEAAGVDVSVGLLEAAARELNAPYLKLLATGRPWIIAKWAMTLDGKLASRTGNSKWISCDGSRAVVHALRGRVDAIVVGRGSAIIDDPQLTTRPPGPRNQLRIVVDSQASLPNELYLVQSAREVPTLVAVAESASTENCERLRAAGCEVFVCRGIDHSTRFTALLDELGRRHLTNVLVEGGSKLLGSLFDLQAIDEVDVFIATKLIGGSTAPSPIAGQGIAEMADALRLIEPTIETLDGDIHIHGRLSKHTGKV